MHIPPKAVWAMYIIVLEILCLAVLLGIGIWRFGTGQPLAIFVIGIEVIAHLGAAFQIIGLRKLSSKREKNNQPTM